MMNPEFSPEKARIVEQYWNPQNKAIAAEYWQSQNGNAGFSPVCANKKNRALGCRLFEIEQPCRNCPAKEYLPLDQFLILEHLKGTRRIGIYPLIDANKTMWVAADLDNHDSRTDPVSDLKKLITVTQALDIGIHIFTSNSNMGCHVYVFFDAPILAYKARALMTALLQRAGIDVRRNNTSSFDCLFPKQDSLNNGNLGNLIALPWSGEAIRNRSATLYLNPGTLQICGESVEENIEYFDEEATCLSEADVDALLKEMQVLPQMESGNLNLDLSNVGNQNLSALIDQCAFLEHCRNDAAHLPEPQWYNMICVLAHEYKGAALIHELSRPYPKYSKSETDAKIIHAINDLPGPVTCHKIKQDWNCGKDCGVTSPVHLIKAPPQPVFEVVDPNAPYVPERKTIETSIPFLNVGGLLGGCMEFIDKNAPVSYPLFNMAGSLAFLGAVAGQRIQSETRIRTNFYNICLGYSGSGKDAPQALLPLLLENTSAANVLGPTELASGAALFKYLANKDKHSSIIVFDEIGMLIKAANQPNSPLGTLVRYLTKFYSGSTKPPESKTYADGTDVYLPWQHLCFFGASTPNMFWDNILKEHIESGFFGRCLIFESRHDPIKPPPSLPTLKIPKALSKELEKIFQIRCETVPKKPGNLEDPKIIPNTVYRTPEALELLSHWMDANHNRQKRYKNHPSGSVFNRAFEHLEKIVLIHALSLHGHNIIKKRIDADSYEFGMALVDYLTQNVIQQIEENVAENPWHKKEQQVIKAITNHATNEKPGLTPSVLFGHYVKGLKPREKQELIEGMIEDGKVFKVPYKAANGYNTEIICVKKGTSDV